MFADQLDDVPNVLGRFLWSFGNPNVQMEVVFVIDLIGIHLSERGFPVWNEQEFTPLVSDSEQKLTDIGNTGMFFHPVGVDPFEDGDVA